MSITTNNKSNKSFVRKLTGNLLAILIGSFVALLLAEVITRVVMPIFPGTHKLDEKGSKVDLHDIAAGKTFRQFSAEFDAHTKITKDGYRYPESKGNPEVIFIGDSFTYGQGLSDEETFIMQYCKQASLQCMNLGVPGYGTINAVERLDSFLQEKEARPRKVYLVMLAMTSFLGAGNDLYDNIKITDQRNSKKQNDGEEIEYKETPLRRISNQILRLSNFARVIKFNFAPMIKSKLVVKPEEDQLEIALKLTQISLTKLSELAKKYNFIAEIILIHPMQDISRGTHKETLDKISSITDLTIIPSAEYFLPNPTDYYFAMDGHFNLQGSNKMVKLLNSIE